MAVFRDAPLVELYPFLQSKGDSPGFCIYKSFIVNPDRIYSESEEAFSIGLIDEETERNLGEASSESVEDSDKSTAKCAPERATLISSYPPSTWLLESNLSLWI